MSSAQVLRDGGIRATAQRQAVLAALRERPHASAAQLAGTLAAGSKVSKQGVYNVLLALVGAGLVRRIEVAGSAARYELRVGDNHHHVICRRCGRIEDVDCAVGGAPCLHPADAGGFVIDEAEVTWWAICQECCDMTTSLDSEDSEQQDHVLSEEMA